MSDITIKIIALVIGIAIDYAIVMKTLQGSKLCLYFIIFHFIAYSILDIIKLLGI